MLQIFKRCAGKLALIITLMRTRIHEFYGRSKCLKVDISQLNSVWWFCRMLSACATFLAYFTLVSLFESLCFPDFWRYSSEFHFVQFLIFSL